MWALEPDYLGFYISFYMYDVGQVIFIFHLKDDDNGHVSCWGNKRYSFGKRLRYCLAIVTAQHMVNTVIISEQNMNRFQTFFGISVILITSILSL